MSSSVALGTVVMVLAPVSVFDTASVLWVGQTTMMAVPPLSRVSPSSSTWELTSASSFPRIGGPTARRRRRLRQ